MNSSRSCVSHIEIPNLKISDTAQSGSVESGANCPDIQIWREANGETTAYCHESNGLYWIRWLGVAGYCFDRQARVVTAFPEPNLDSFLIEDTYLRSILPIVQHLLGNESLHASAVLMPGGVVGLIGASMAGKSTLAYGLSCRGCSLFSDDALILEISDSRPQALFLPFKLHLRSSSAKFFDLDPAIFARRSAPLEAHEGRSDKEHLSALFVLGRGSQPARTAVVRRTPTEALTDLLSHAHCFSLKNEDRKRQMIHNFLTIADRVPVFSVQFERRLEILWETLDQIDLAIRSIQTS